MIGPDGGKLLLPVLPSSGGRGTTLLVCHWSTENKYYKDKNSYSFVSLYVPMDR